LEGNLYTTEGASRQITLPVCTPLAAWVSLQVSQKNAATRRTRYAQRHPGLSSLHHKDRVFSRGRGRKSTVAAIPAGPRQRPGDPVRPLRGPLRSCFCPGWPSDLPGLPAAVARDGPASAMTLGHTCCGLRHNRDQSLQGGNLAQRLHLASRYRRHVVASGSNHQP
jgi:hypothetical protein